MSTLPRRHRFRHALNSAVVATLTQIAQAKLLFTIVLAMAACTAWVSPAVAVPVPLSAAASTVIPSVPGDGIRVELFLGTGGGTPTPARLAPDSPEGELLSPAIDFPRPGAVVNVNQGFSVFFGNTAVAPDAVAALPASSFILRNTAFLKVTRNLDRNPATPAIDILIGAGTDDGHYVAIGPVFFGQGGDRGFGYSWYAAEFEDEGLYPLYYLMSANSAGQSGCELSWQTTRGNEIIPQEFLYQSITTCSENITFEEFPVGTRLTDQFRALGALFNVLAGDLQVTNAFPADFPPHTGDRVFADPMPNPVTPGALEITFVEPGTSTRGAVNFFQCYVIDAEAIGCTITAFGRSSETLFQDTFNAGGATQERVDIAAVGIARIVIETGFGTDTTAIDSVCFSEPYSIASPDLSVTTLTAPLTGDATRPATASWTVTNGGDAAALGSWTDRVYISTDNTFEPATDTLLDSVTINGPLAPAGQYSRERSVTLPSTPGTYYLIVVTDAAGTITENPTEANNVRVADDATTIVAADLTVTAVGVPPGHIAGQALNVTYNVRNVGSGAAVGPWVDRVFLSTDAIVGNDVQVAEFVRTDGLAASESYDRQFTVPIAIDVETPRYVIVVTDTGNSVYEPAGDATNSRVSDAVLVTQPPLPDLQVDSLVAPPSAFKGSTISVGWVTRNAGTLPAVGSWVDRVYLSTDAEFSASDTPLTPFVGPSPLLAGATYEALAQVTLPTTPGTFWLIVRADANDNIEEGARDDNNTRVAATPIVIDVLPRPDLLPTAVVPPPSGTAGATIDVQWTVRNNGNETATGTWSDRLLLSNDATLGGDLVLGTFDRSGPLADEVEYNVTQTVTVPFAAEGVYRILVVTDVDDDVFESGGETNNLLASATTITVSQPALPDLNAFELNVPTTGTTGQAIDITWRVRNDGELPATGNWIDRVYISANNVLDAPDVQIGDAAITGPLDPAGEYQAGDSILLPGSPGNYNIIVVSNSSATVEEGSARANNIRVTATPIAVSFPPRADIVVESIMIPSIAAIGDQVELRWTVGNDGPVAATGTWSERIFASADANIGGDIQLANFVYSDNNIAPDASIERIRNIPVPNLPSGYYIVVCLDANGGLAEENESNNCDISDQAAPVSRPDLAIEIVTAPPAALADGPITINWVVRNIGETTAFPQWLDSVYLSTDLEFDAGDILLGSVPRLAAVSAGGGYAAALSATVPGRIRGTYYAIVRADSANAVNETGPSSNNTQVAASATAIDQPPRADLIVTSIVEPAGGLMGSSGLVRWTVRNDGPAAATGAWADRVIARPVVGEGSDIVLAEQFWAASVAAGGGTYEQMATVQYPPIAGEYRIVVITDRADTLNEGLDGGESNNTLVDDATFIVEGYRVEVATTLDQAVSPTAVPLTGRALRLGTNEPLINVPVAVAVTVRGSARVINAVTNELGEFVATFNPLPSEAGSYRLTAGPPGAIDPSAQDSFLLYGFRAEPRNINADVFPGTPVNGVVTLINNGDATLTDLTATVGALPDGITLTATPPTSTISSQGSVAVSVQIAATALQATQVQTSITFSTAQGASVVVPININTRATFPVLVANPTSLAGEMIRGQQTLVEFQVRNIGAATATGLRLNLPSGVSWLQPGVAQVPDLAAGQSATILLHLLPEPTLPLGTYGGAISVTNEANTVGTTIAYSFRNVSDQLADVEVGVEDEYTYWSTGVYNPDGPLVAGARVALLNPETQAVVVEGITDADGQIEFNNVTEGDYFLRVSATRHAPYRQLVSVLAAQPNSFRPFLPRETVRYNWSVTETDIEDITIITLEAVFQTNVPVPVVTLDPPVIDFAQIRGDTAQIDLRVKNHGLIIAEDVALNLPSHPLWRVTPLVNDLGDLAAQEERVVPVVIERIDTQPLDAGPCELSAGLTWTLVCAGRNQYWVPLPYLNLKSGCGGIPGNTGPGGGGCWCGGGSSGPGGGGTYSFGPTYASEVECDPCDEDFEPETLLGVDLSYLFAPAEGAVEAYVAAQTAGWIAADVNISAEGGVMTCCRDGAIGLTIGATADAEIELSLQRTNFGFEFSETVSLPVDTGLGEVELISVPVNLNFNAGLNVAANGSLGGSANIGCFELDPVACVNGGIGANASLGVMSSGSAQVNIPGQETTVAEFTGNAFFATSANASFEWCSDTGLTGSACFTGVYAEVEISASLLGQTFEPIPCQRRYFICPAGTCEPLGECNDMGCSGIRPAEPFVENLPTKQELRDMVIARLPKSLYRIRTRAEDGDMPIRPRGDGVCAEVRLQLEQSVAITRTAFSAQLEIENSDPIAPVENIFVAFDVYDVNGNLVSDRFGIGAPQLNLLTGVDGNGTLPALSTGSVRWLILPAPEAAPMVPTQYFVSGVFQYTQNGVGTVVPLERAPITVRPDPSLFLRYFWQRDVFADDPFTADIVEPSEPFSIGLLMKNDGFGTARNVRITSAQPRITENERGLLIAFELIGAQVGTQPINPSLTVNLGDIGPQQIAQARWLMTSTLQGQFVEYSARYENQNEFGNDPRFSLIDGISIYELIHAVRADVPGDDFKLDFMSNEIEYPLDPFEDPTSFDLRDLPDTIHLSSGPIEPVTPVLTPLVQITSSGQTPTARVEANMPGTWAYLKFPDPFDGQFPISRVTRDDGKQLILDFNVWQTDRSFREGTERPLRQHRVHLFDRGGPGVYTIEFNRRVVAPGEVPIGSLTAATLRLIDIGGVNLPETEHAVFEEISGKWVGANGRLVTTPFWQPRSACTNFQVRALPAATLHRFYAVARDANQVVTPAGPSTSVTTRGPGDVNGDGIVNLADVVIVNASLGRSYGQPGFDARADLSGDDHVTYRDLGIVRRNQTAPVIGPNPPADADTLPESRRP